MADLAIQPSPVGRAMLELACHLCGHPLAVGRDATACPGCGATYRTLRGIPDLRTSDDGYLPNEADWSLAEQLDAAFDELDFRGMLDLYFDLNPEITSAQRKSQIQHILTAKPRAEGWLEALGTDVPHGPWLDLGCGSGSFLASVASDGREVVGLDVAIRWLIVARKRLDEEGSGHVRLVCGNAEQLPFRDQGFAAVIAGDVIEHVADQAATLAESHRVLKPGGRLFMATPNRFSLAPEPHVGVWGVGFLPRNWMPGYVRLVRRIDFRAIRTLSYAGWSRMLARSPFGEVSIRSPALPATEVAAMPWIKRSLASGYNRLVADRPGQALTRLVGPLFHIVATRSDESPPSLPPRQPTTP